VGITWQTGRSVRVISPYQVAYMYQYSLQCVNICRVYNHQVLRYQCFYGMQNIFVKATKKGNVLSGPRRCRSSLNREDLAKQGYLLVIDFIAHVKKTAKQKAHTEQLVMSTMDSEQESEESAPKELNIKDLVSKCIAEICCNGLLMTNFVG
jgi:hypothetical protein